MCVCVRARACVYTTPFPKKSTYMIIRIRLLQLYAHLKKASFTTCYTADYLIIIQYPIITFKTHIKCPLENLKFLNKCFFSYQSTLKQLFQEFEKGDDSNAELASVTMRIMQALQSNLEGKSKQYKDPALTNLFLMNNIHYMVRSVRRFDI